jgi:DNA gyrase/topoisomerase IV subunit A
MDARERQAAEDRSALLEVALAALHRRHEVVDLVWAATDDEEASSRLRDLLGIDERVDPRVVLDMQVWRLTESARGELAADLEQLRRELAASA